jgi:hypothetical protein
MPDCPSCFGLGYHIEGFHSSDGGYQRPCGHCDGTGSVVSLPDETPPPTERATNLAAEPPPTPTQ